VLHFCFDPNALLIGGIAFRHDHGAISLILPTIRLDSSKIMARFALIHRLADKNHEIATKRSYSLAANRLRHETLRRKINHFKKISWRNPNA
jgi:hypothetical protein